MEVTSIICPVNDDVYKSNLHVTIICNRHIYISSRLTYIMYIHGCANTNVEDHLPPSYSAYSVFVLATAQGLDKGEDQNDSNHQRHIHGNPVIRIHVNPKISSQRGSTPGSSLKLLLSNVYR